MIFWHWNHWHYGEASLIYGPSLWHNPVTRTWIRNVSR